MTRVTNKNLHVLTSKKGSKMTKKRGSKKGQKWPKMGVQKKAKKGQKPTFFMALKIDTHKNKNKLTQETIKNESLIKMCI
jgi:hypothetical protein